MNRRALFIVTGALLALVVGYAAGRKHAIGEIRSAILASLRVQDGTELPAGPTSSVRESDTYQQLNHLLDERLLAARQKSDRWLPMLLASTTSGRDKLLSSMKSELVNALGPSPDLSGEPSAVVRPWFTADSVEVSIVEIAGFGDVTLTCALLIPARPPPRPALLVLHGYGGNLQTVVSDIDYHRGLGMRLAKEGYVVLAPLNVGTSIATRGTLHLKSLAAGWSLSGLEVRLFVHLVDYLTSLKVVDRSHVGVYGVSQGGEQALRLGALDNRLSLVVSSAYFAARFDWLFCRQTPSATSPVGSQITSEILPYEAPHFTTGMDFLLNDVNLVALVQPRFFGVVTGTQDPRYSSAVSAYSDVESLYRHVGRPDRAELLVFEGGHETSVKTVLPFLRRWADNTAPSANH